jgi:hypothetical protein
LLAVPIAATAEVLLEGLQARRVPVAQDPGTSGLRSAIGFGPGDAEDASNSPSDPDSRPKRRRPRVTRGTAA